MMTDKQELDEINISEYFDIIKKKKKLIISVCAGITALTAVISLFLPRYYKAVAVIMPTSGGSSFSGGQIGGLASLIVPGIASQSPNRQIIALLKTRSLAIRVINKYDLLPILLKNNDESKPNGKKMQSAAENLLGMISFDDNKKDGIISISAELRDPKLATMIANGYVEELQNFINDNSFTLAKRNKIFIEEQLLQSQRELLEAGKLLNEFYKTGRVSNVGSKVDVSLVVDSNLQETINRLKERKKILQGEVEEYPDERIVSDQTDDLAEINDKIVRGVPQQVYLQYLTLRRNLLAQINTLLTQQYEMAKIDESRDDLSFQILDPASEPETCSRPKKREMVMIAIISSIFFSILILFIIEFFQKSKKYKTGNLI